MQIKCIGNRKIEVFRDGVNIAIKLTWRDKYLSTLLLEKEEALKLVGELNGLIRFEQRN